MHLIDENIKWSLFPLCMYPRKEKKMERQKPTNEEAVPRWFIEEWKKNRTSVEQIVADKILMDWKWERVKDEAD